MLTRHSPTFLPVVLSALTTAERSLEAGDGGPGSHQRRAEAWRPGALHPLVDGRLDGTQPGEQQVAGPVRIVHLCNLTYRHSTDTHERMQVS